MAAEAKRLGIETWMQADGFDEAFLRFQRRRRGPWVAVYSVRKCIAILARNMSLEEAEEFFWFNVDGAWMGPLTPLFRSR